MTSESDSFANFVVTRGPALTRTAFLMTGDWHSAEDLVQATLIRMFGVWRRLERREEAEPYARRTLTRLYLDQRRLRRSTERVTAELPEPEHDSSSSADAALDLLGALAKLPARQRAVVILRYWEDLEVATVSDILNLPIGTVKSLSSRGLAALRADLPDYRPVEHGPHQEPA